RLPAHGTIVATRSFGVETKLDETPVEIFDHFLSGFIAENPDIDEVILPIEIHPLPGNIRMTIPQLGDKKKLLQLSYINARSYAMSLITDPKYQKRRKEFDILKELQDKLKLKDLPVHIECFDNSNIQGTNPVSACVVFKNGLPAKKYYRHFHIKTVEGPNDFASMKEIVGRRYKRLLEEGKPLPKLVVIDGGKGQLSSAVEALQELGIYGKMPIIGIAKRLEEIYFPGDSYPIHIDKKSESLKLLQRIRDEAHRFAITFHRNVRSKNAFKSQLIEIPGIGESTLEKLLKHFKSVKKIQNAKEEELIDLLGSSKAKILTEWVEKNKGA
nr:helix-hairpin-helix domain-containing protein [Algoriphagus sp.]